MEGVFIVSRRRKAIISFKCDLRSVERESNIQCFEFPFFCPARVFLVKTAALSRKCLCSNAGIASRRISETIRAQNALLMRTNWLSHRAGAEKVSPLFTN